MSNYSDRILKLTRTRDTGRAELQRTARDLSAEAIAHRRGEIEAEFDAGIAALASDFGEAQAAAQTAIARAQYAVTKAAYTCPPAQRENFAAAELALRIMTPAQIVSF